MSKASYKKVFKLLTVALLVGSFFISSAAQAIGPTTTVYNAVPNPVPGNVASLGFQATSTSEFGDYIHLAGAPDRLLNTATITMSDWALQATPANITFCTNNPTKCPSGGFIHPITINIYSSHLGANGAPDTLLTTKTQDVTVPWRPVADPTCPGGTAWRNPTDSQCYNGYAFNVDFDMSASNVTLPNDVIVGVAYNTQSYGSAPIGVDGPYNSLNLGVASGQTATTGTDDNSDQVFWNTSFAGFYTDGGTSGVGIFRKDIHWGAGFGDNGTVNIRLTTTPATPSTIVVTSSDLETTTSVPTAATNNSGKWFFYNDTNDTINNALGSFVNGPATAPAGIGSAEMTDQANPNDRLDIATYGFQNTKLSDITALGFSAYSHSGVAGATESPYLVFNVSFDGSGTYQRRLVYVPSNNGSVPQDSWNTFDTINGGAGKWVYSGANWPAPNAIPGTSTKTWAQILADYPSAKILPVGGLVGVRVGEPGPTNYTGNVDKFVFGTAPTLKTFDFEPSKGSIEITKYACPAGTNVVRSLNGVGLVVPAGCIPQTGKTFGYVHGSQTDANGPYPELSTPLTAGGSTDGSGVLTIANLPATGRYLVAETDESNQQLPSSEVLGLYCTGDGDTSDNNDNQELTFVPANGVVKCVAYDLNPADTTAPDMPVHLSPADNTVTTTALQTLIDWTDVTDPSAPVTYVYQASNSSDINLDGSFVSPVYTSGALTVSEIPTPGTPAGVYYWHVKACDAASNCSSWTNAWKITIDNTPPAPSHVHVTIEKYIDANHATAENAGGDTFTMQADYAFTNEAFPSGITGSDPYTLSLVGNNTPTSYEAKTLEFYLGANYSTHENMNDVVGTSCDSDTPFALVGYSVGEDEAAALASPQSTDAPSFSNLQSNKFVIVWNHKCTVVPPTPTNGHVHIYKFIDGEQATTETAGGVSFPMFTSTYNAPFTLGPNGWTGGDVAYEASTSEMTAGSPYTANEDTTTSLVGTSCSAENHPTYELSGYSTGTSLENAISNGESKTLTPPNFTTDGEQYLIVWNHKCGEVLGASTIKVHVYKYLDNNDGGSAQIPNDSTAPAFPMTATWSADNIGSGTGAYVLGNNHGGTALKYAADTAPMSTPANYTTSEVVDGSVVVANVGSCSAGKYYLEGYKTSAVSLSDAEGQPTISPTAPEYNGLTTDAYIIVINKKCADDVPPPPPAPDTCDANAQVILNGSFEDGVDAGSFTTLSSGDSTSITNWTVGDGSVDLIGSYWSNSNGSKSIDLNSLTAGSVTQTIPTVVGQSYTVTFDLSGNPDNNVENASPTKKDVLVTATGGAATVFSYDTATKGNSDADMKWEQESYTFTATSTSTTITFASQIAGAFGPALDNVSVKANCPPVEDTFTLTYIAGANGTISGTTPQTVNSGANGTPVTAVANSGFHFTSWSDSSTANPRTDTDVTANHSFTANFAANPEETNTHTLNYSANSGGTLTGSTSQTVNDGASGTAVTVVPNSGFHFTNWSDNSTSNPRTDTNVTANINVIANFSPDVQSNSQGGSGGGGGSFTSGGSVGKVLGASIDNTPKGEVKGAETSCGIYITVGKFLRMGNKNNDVEAVKKLQHFLNTLYPNAGIKEDGVFGADTDKYVRKFQAEHKAHVLTPWNFKGPTGIVYLTTITEINNLFCPALNLPIPTNLK